MPRDGTSVESRDRRSRLGVLVALGFAGYLLLGLAICDDYGVSWDEQINRSFGIRTLDLVKARLGGGGVERGQDGRLAEFGPAFELVLAGLEDALGIEDSREILLARHRATFAMFWLGTVAFFLLLRRVLRDERVACLGALLLVLSPRLFADSFYNSKDAVLASLFAISTLTMLRFLEKRTWGWGCLHALACALAIDVRLVGLLLPGVTLFLLRLEWIERRFASAERQRIARDAALYLAALAVFVPLFWPQLWDSPGQLLERLGGLGAARQSDNRFALFAGAFLPVEALPWTYLPTWMALTIPPPVTALFAIGAVVCGRALVRAPGAKASRPSWIFALLLLTPVVAVMALRPVLYDGWRHLYFVYPALLGIAMLGVDELAVRRSMRFVALAAAGIAVVHSAVCVIRLHPYQQVYFNAFAGRDVEQRFELDYWGLSFREGLEKLLEREPSGVVRVAVSDLPGRLNRDILEASQRARIEIVPLARASYFVSNHRSPSHFERFRRGLPPYVDPVHCVEVDGARLLCVYALR